MRLTAIIAACLLPSTHAAAAQIWVTMDQVRPYEIDTPAAQIVVGNPAIADVTVLDNKKILLFGKAPGFTNIFLFDESGATIDELNIRVGSTDNRMVTVQLGGTRKTLNCTNRCEQAIAVGDDNVSFGILAGQTQTKLQQATSSASQ